jgi:hypothetical protein
MSPRQAEDRARWAGGQGTGCGCATRASRAFIAGRASPVAVLLGTEDWARACNQTKRCAGSSGGSTSITRGARERKPAACNPLGSKRAAARAASHVAPPALRPPRPTWVGPTDGPKHLLERAARRVRRHTACSAARGGAAVQRPRDPAFERGQAPRRPAARPLSARSDRFTCSLYRCEQAATRTARLLRTRAARRRHRRRRAAGRTNSRSSSLSGRLAGVRRSQQQRGEQAAARSE